MYFQELQELSSTTQHLKKARQIQENNERILSTELSEGAAKGIATLATSDEL